VGNEENGYPVLDLNKTMINGTKELSNAHKKTLKEEIWEEHPKIYEKYLHAEDIRHGQPEYTTCTQEISRHQKQRA
jgi:hypothetical protein